MNKKLSDRLNSFPKDYQLNQETELKIESILQEEIKKMEKQAKSKGLKDFLKKLTIPVSGITAMAIVTLLLLSSQNIDIFQKGLNGSSSNAETEVGSVEDKQKIKELSTVWANALKTRDGKPRYEMMSEKAKEKFVQEQIIRSGENWNYNIGESSPWVVDYEIEIDGMNAVITYKTQTSIPSFYHTKETLTFKRENKKFVVDDYQTIFENKPIEENELLVDGDEKVTEHMHQIISDYIIAKHQMSDYQQTDIQFEVHKIYGTMEVNDTITVYLWSYYNSFNKITGSETVTGVSLPMAIKLMKMSKDYEVVDFMVPNDGSEYVSSLKSVFPEKYVDIAIQNAGNIEDLKSEMKSKIEEWLEQPEQETDKTITWSSKNNEVNLIPVKDTNDEYQGVTVEVNNVKKEFSWSFPKLEESKPRVFFTDVTGDGDEEAIIILNKGKGTGLSTDELHVLNSKDLSEIKVQNFEGILAEHVETNVTKSGEGLTIKVKVQGKESKFDYDFDPAPDLNQDKLAFGGVVLYTLENKRIKLYVPGSIGVSPTYVADFNIIYKFDSAKNEFTVNQIEFVPIDK
ncbi:hypothetical protein F7731_12055 [Cytobacillus depressus]|uniref:Uncharacterized protein n=1 Tax=Cytobacillus depressus TaxID=1602942 RepID=A0A6L3V535_9BACI|nr:hypothetical protein [Cytobacillus depressus]KAB2336224.1 hypothetical protein F7731_12055 [Cytobacillus depressus]